MLAVRDLGHQRRRLVRARVGVGVRVRARVRVKVRARVRVRVRVSGRSCLEGTRRARGRAKR